MALQASKQGLQWYQDSRFGMFIHWGLYAILGIEEWVMHINKIPVPEYEKLVPQFNPVKFNADEWVSIAADAGQKYMVITSRHHDGFSMFDTAHSDYKVTNTPFKRDPIHELADAVARRGDIKLGFYSSLIDWHHPAYRFREESGLAWSDYIDFLHGQVRELCTNYGDLACMWFDGDWQQEGWLNESNTYFLPGGDFGYEELYDMIHMLQPHAVILANRHTKPQPGEDIQGFEQELPGSNEKGFNPSEIYELPIEVCMTINDHWGYSKTDRNTKTLTHLIHLLTRSASVGGNYLLNVGPTAEGEILALHAERLAALGAWLQTNGEAIYGTRTGRIPPTRVSVSTAKEDKHYLHILQNLSDTIALTDVPESITQAHLLKDGSAVELQRENDKVKLYIPQEKRDPHNTVLVLE